MPTRNTCRSAAYKRIYKIQQIFKTLHFEMIYCIGRVNIWIFRHLETSRNINKISDDYVYDEYWNPRTG